MTDILLIDYSLMSASLSNEEIDLLKQYQSLAINLNELKSKLEQITLEMTTATPEKMQNLSELATDLQKNIGSLSTVFKSTVHNVLLHMNSNLVVNEDVALAAAEMAKSLKDTITNDAADDDVDMDYLADDNNPAKGSNLSSNAEYNNTDSKETNNNNNNNNHDNHNNEDEDDDVDLGSGIDEETLKEVNRIEDEFAMTNDIHRQIADQLEINNPDDY